MQHMAEHTLSDVGNYFTLIEEKSKREAMPERPTVDEADHLIMVINRQIDKTRLPAGLHRTIEATLSGVEFLRKLRTQVAETRSI